MSLIRRQDGHGSEPHDIEFGFPDEHDRREHDVPDDSPVVLGNQRYHRVRLLAQRIHEGSLVRAFERFGVDGANRRAIGFPFRADQQMRL